MNYSNYFNFQDWWTDASYHTEHFYKHAGPIEMAIMAATVMVVGLICMRGFQIR